jgi:methionyl aminopeptidase
MILGRGHRRTRSGATPTVPSAAQMHPASDFVAEVLSRLQSEIRVGDTLEDIDARTHEMIQEAGATSCYVDYHPRFGAYPFGKVMCTSVNDVVLHGRPYGYTLADGDLLSLDFAVELEGWVADSALSFVVGTPRAQDQDLIRDVEQVMWTGIDQVRAGNTVGHVGHAVEAEAHRLGYTINHQFGGHGVGRTMHEAPFVPNHGTPGSGAELHEGMVLTVEPFLMHTTDQVHITDRDGWSVVSEDGSRGAHAEHTLYVTDDAPIVLTLREGETARAGVPPQR